MKVKRVHTDAADSHDQEPARELDPSGSVPTVEHVGALDAQRWRQAAAVILLAGDGDIPDLSGALPPGEMEPASPLTPPKATTCSQPVSGTSEKAYKLLGTSDNLMSMDGDK